MVITVNFNGRACEDMWLCTLIRWSLNTDAFCFPDRQTVTHSVCGFPNLPTQSVREKDSTAS